MKYPSYKKELDALFQRKIVVDVIDFATVFGDMPMTSVYARIRGMVKEGTLSVIGKGRYVACEKPQYRVVPSDWMKRCNAVMVKELVGVSSCMTERNGNLEIEVGKDDRQVVLETLSRHFEKVMLWDDVKYLKVPPRGCIIVGRLVTEAPFLIEEGVGIPAPEKFLVDTIRRKEYSDKDFQRIMEVYPINLDSMRRYASRRGVAEELEECIEKLNRQRMDMFTKVQSYLSHTPVIRAWVFGSFARGEETTSSDLDLIVDYDKSAVLSLITIVRYQLDMEKLIGRKVDLVENGFLKPFSQASAERDKYLIYER